MADFEHSQDVNAPSAELFDYLAEISNLPKYFAAMISAEPAGGDAIHVVADVDGTERGGEAWFRVDRAANHLEWGAKGPNNYHGELDVTEDGTGSRVTVTLHTERADAAAAGDIDEGIVDTLAEIKRLVEGRDS
jgi:hypothetical protein